MKSDPNYGPAELDAAFEAMCDVRTHERPSNGARTILEEFYKVFSRPMYAIEYLMFAGKYSQENDDGRYMEKIQETYKSRYSKCNALMRDYIGKDLVEEQFVQEHLESSLEPVRVMSLRPLSNSPVTHDLFRTRLSPMTSFELACHP